MPDFKLYSKYKPQGDQPEAIDKLVKGIKKGYRFQTLLGVTGSGKTFTMANVIERLNRPTLILSPNKILAVQLYREFKEFFPENKVEFFISYYDYYQPEAYIPTRDMYIEKDASINEILQKMRLSTLKSVLTRRDVIVVSSVSAIYASGNPEDFANINLKIKVGEEYNRRFILESLAKMLYNRSEDKHTGGNFRFKGDILEIYPPYEDFGIRIEFFDDEVEKIYSFDILNRTKIESFDKITIYPASEFVTTEEKIMRATQSIREELEERLKELQKAGKLLEAQRLKQRTLMDIELLETLGHCKGIENYSRHFDMRKPGEPPWTLLDYFDDDFITFIDETHIAIPQLRAMWAGDHSRKRNLIEYGFRLPSAFDNRPLKFDEFISKIRQTIFVSATPGSFEFEHSEQVVEQIIRPTGLIDPEVIVRPTMGQVDDFIAELKKIISRNERAIAVVLTKKDAEMLSDHLNLLGIKATYLHSELDAIERAEVIRKLRSGEIDAVIGVNLLREGLDLPEVSLVAIMDSDREGFLRSETTLIQTIGRAARNINGKVILYADKITEAMQKAIYETNRRRKIQMYYNEKNNIIPKSIIKELPKNIFEQFMEKTEKPEFIFEVAEGTTPEEYIQLLEAEMFKAASELRYEDAAKYRDEIKRVKKKYRIK
ncbi:excinuclease ABC subunit B [Marinitoga sp. 1135]|uniref:UvrABC system protein B n=1 Tax=Marinitoga piezophila (strain DSM 14283 / JCM 11233 / KA3) TaxID=443254 RepID=H2J621_MARPK|nr:MULTISPECIES: excinuclease ABC subunit UvrB [Marinitoga]AEX85082.1 excinuclease ABC, B subunit [Marinitoga piezophila KA3]APT75589.1 excinuclease ABC subunit B [Marinitoga sp. 1137]NUU95297.1 excinuclease ABC subunit B [Marinitoga sp. 1135]